LSRPRFGAPARCCQRFRWEAFGEVTSGASQSACMNMQDHTRIERDHASRWIAMRHPFHGEQRVWA
jgi:hypothetical protein